jgi:hypothetical protein
VSGNVFTSTSKCWERAGPGSAPWGTGDRRIVSHNEGKLSPMKRKGGSRTLTLRYLWQTGTNATETATLTGAKTPTIHSKIVLKGDSGLRIEKWLTPLKRAPELPLVSQRPPFDPEPRPICKDN